MITQPNHSEHLHAHVLSHLSTQYQKHLDPNRYTNSCNIRGVDIML